MNNRQYLLNKIAEEASEVAQMACKCSQFGLEQTYVKVGKTNWVRLQEELTDLLTCFALLEKEEGYVYTPDYEAKQRKEAKIVHYKDVSIRLGQTQPTEEV